MVGGMASHAKRFGAPMPFDGQENASEHNVSIAEAAGLHYGHEDDLTLRRKGAGRGFSYVDDKGHGVQDEATLDRIRHLAIPPAYKDVRIAADPLAHLQAVGVDARGRKQYRYHPNWRKARDETKFGRMAAFGRALPAIRARVDADLRKHALTRDKVLAAVVSLLELTLIRVGNDQYARDNKSFGLTTLRGRHVKNDGAGVVFTFKGKSGVQHRTTVHDRRLTRIVKALQDLPGQRLFQYLDESGDRHAVGSHDVNAYLQAITGENFTAKDFRTWAGTLAAAKALALQPKPQSQAEGKRLANLCIKATSGLLGNTPAVCRKAYIHPGVLSAFAKEGLPKSFAKAEGAAFERAVLAFLRKLASTPEPKPTPPGEAGRSRTL
jgi:DNA topoisomerase-1